MADGKSNDLSRRKSLAMQLLRYGGGLWVTVAFIQWYISDGSSDYFTMLAFVVRHPGTFRPFDFVSGVTFLVAPALMVTLGVLVYPYGEKALLRQEQAEARDDETVWPPPPDIPTA